MPLQKKIAGKREKINVEFRFHTKKQKKSFLTSIDKQE